MTASPSPPAYDAARQRSAFLDRSAGGWLVVSGADRASYLQGLLTNDMLALGPGQGCYAAYLTAQGRMISDLFAYELGDVMLLALPRETKGTVLARLSQFIFSEDVQLGDVTDAFARIGLLGPDAARVLRDVLHGAELEALGGLREHGNLRVAFAADTAIVTRTSDAGELGFDVYVDVRHRDSLVAAVRDAGVLELDAATADAIRIEAGVPRFAVDMNEETIPLEAGIESRAISFTKGCYVGQEVIVRVLHRGHGRVVRKLVGLTWKGSGPAPAGTMLRADAREVGTITSSTVSPSLKQPIALGYVHRDFVEPGTTVLAGDEIATVASLPFIELRR
jgi:tRNA-modifying protein YgfZ